MTSVNVTVNGTYFEVVGDFRPEVKARTYGPPENCYPGEPAEFRASEAWFDHQGTRIGLHELPEGVVSSAMWAAIDVAALEACLLSAADWSPSDEWEAA